MKYGSRLIVLLAMLGCLAGGPQSLRAQVTDAEELATASTPGAIAVEPSARDGEIRERLARIMEATGWFTRLDVRVREGIVFLDGTTDTEGRKTWARELALKLQDVVAVVNNIEVAATIDWSFRPARQALAQLANDFVTAIPLVVVALLLLPTFWIAARYVRRLARWAFGSSVQSPMLLQVIGNLIALPVLLIGIYIVLQVAGLTSLALSVLGGAGVIGIVIGFAFRDIAENFLAGILLSIRQPFNRGDFISVSGQAGVVNSLNSRSTILVSLEGNHIVIPNAAVFKSVIINFSSAPHRRETLSVGIGYNDSVAEAQEEILKVLLSHPSVLKEPAPMVLVEALGAATVNLRIHFWFDGHQHSVFKVKSALYRLIKRALMSAGISMPDEAREVVFPKGVPIVPLERNETPTAPAGPLTEGDGKVTVDEPADAVTNAEGGLANEEDDAERQAATGTLPEGGADLLSDTAQKRGSPATG